MPLRLLKKTKIKIKPKTLAISNITSISRRVTMPINTPKSQKTSGSFGNFYIDNWQKNRKKSRLNTLYLLSHNFQRSDKGFTRLKKQSQCNKPNFYLLIRPQNLKN